MLRLSVWAPSGPGNESRPCEAIAANSDQGTLVWFEAFTMTGEVGGRDRWRLGSITAAAGAADARDRRRDQHRDDHHDPEHRDEDQRNQRADQAQPIPRQVPEQRIGNECDSCIASVPPRLHRRREAIRHTGSQFSSGVVQFAAGARIRMHTYTRDQLLYIVSDIGKVGTREKEHVVRTGDLVVIPAGEPPWHGAGDTGSPLAHFMVLPSDSETDIVE